MNTTQTTQLDNNADPQAPITVNQRQVSKVRPPEKKPLTFGQKVADKMATKVGSWAFLIGQSTVLAGWVGCNMIPGLPHWDESPFMMLNLVFSFASTYTAPVVLMSQNRQSEEDREGANHNYQITLQAAQNLELLHEKLDANYAQKLDELTMLIKQQQQAQSEVKVVFVPAQAASGLDAKTIANLPIFNPHSKGTALVTVGKDLNDVTVKLNN